MIGLIVFLVLGATDPLAKKCEAGDIKACVKLAEKIVRVSEPGEDDEAGDWFEAACKLGSGAACLRGAQWAMSRHGHMPELAVELYAAGCEHDIAEACLGAGPILETGAMSSSRPNPVAARASFDKACTLGSPAGCSESARMLRFNHQTPADPVAARAAWEKACDGGYRPACIELASAERDGWGKPADRERALAIYDRACRTKDRDACLWVQYERARGTLTDKPDLTALAAIVDTCKLGIAANLPCAMKLQLQLQGRLPFDSDMPLEYAISSICNSTSLRACATFNGKLIADPEFPQKKYFSPATGLKHDCDRSQNDACVWYGIELIGDRWHEKDPARGAALIADACARGSEVGCWQWGLSQVTGRGVPANEAAGLTLLEHVCEGGLCDACVTLATIHETKGARCADPAKAAVYREKAATLGGCRWPAK